MQLQLPGLCLRSTSRTNGIVFSTRRKKEEKAIVTSTATLTCTSTARPVRWSKMLEEHPSSAGWCVTVRVAHHSLLLSAGSVAPASHHGGIASVDFGGTSQQHSSNLRRSCAHIG